MQNWYSNDYFAYKSKKIESNDYYCVNELQELQSLDLSKKTTHLQKIETKTINFRFP